MDSISIINVEAEAIVEQGEIIDIVLLKHDNGLGSKAETLLGEMVRTNTYKVDAISGATASSHTIKSAIFDALLKGVQNE